MARIIEKQKIQINQLYFEYRNYSRVARELGIAPSTVKKYVIPDYEPRRDFEKTNFSPQEYDYRLQNVEDWGTLCDLTLQEKEELVKLWKEIA